MKLVILLVLGLGLSSADMMQCLTSTAELVKATQEDTAVDALELLVHTGATHCAPLVEGLKSLGSYSEDTQSTLLAARLAASAVHFWWSYGYSTRTYWSVTALVDAYALGLILDIIPRDYTTKSMKCNVSLAKLGGDTYTWSWAETRGVSGAELLLDYRQSKLYCPDMPDIFQAADSFSEMFEGFVGESLGYIPTATETCILDAATGILNLLVTFNMESKLSATDYYLSLAKAMSFLHVSYGSCKILF